MKENQRSHIELLTLYELEDLLVQAGFDTSTWGTGKTKSVSDLWNEIVEGETVMMRDGESIVRVVHVIGIDVFYEKDGVRQVLVEKEQVWHDGSGRRRSRTLPMSMAEKMLPTDKSAFSAASRGVSEELGITANVLPLNNGEPFLIQRVSDSYPGLSCENWSYAFVQTVDDSEYNPEGYVEDNGVKTTTFVWKPMNG
jgi:hypothetical protein